MRIKITSDSTCDLTKELLTEKNIAVFPLTVIKDNVGFKDNVTITPSEIFAHVAAGGDLCSTTAGSPGEYEEFFRPLTEQYDGIIHISLGSSFSSCYQNASMAVLDHENIRIIDSMNLSTGQGLLVLKACELAKTCDDLDAIVDTLNEYATRIEASFLLNRLDYMVKGGRCSATAALGANLLNLKPCIEVKNGKMSVVKKYRGNYAKCLATYAKDRLANRDDLIGDILFITRTWVDDACWNAVKNAVKESRSFDNVYETYAGCTVSCHCGPETLGVLFVRK